MPLSGEQPVLDEGPIRAGTHLIMPPDTGWAECIEGVDCGPEPPHARTLKVEISVPPGWHSILENTVIVPAPPGGPEAPYGSGIVVGWYPVGLHSDLCGPQGHRSPDILVGPTVESFVDAVVAHPSLDVTEPVGVELGGHSGLFFTLTVPSDLSDCGDYRPWEHGIAAQGPHNIWNVWAIDVDGLRMIVLSTQFPGTSPEHSAELRGMVESIRFVP